MHQTYLINNTKYLNPSKHYMSPIYYPDFQEKFEEFKEKLLFESKNKLNTTYYKFGDGDYYLISKKTVGTSKPGLRDLKKNVDLKKNNKFFSEIISGSQECDNYLCEIKFFDLFQAVMNEKKIDYPAEYTYGIISSKWVFENFDKIGLIGSSKKLEIIKQLMEFTEYQNFLGIDRFEDYIEIPQVYALSKHKSIYRNIKSKIENSKADIFLIGIGLVQNPLLHKLKKHSKVPLLSVGVGIDAIAGVVDIRRPYFGNWKNYQLKNKKIYLDILDPVMKTTLSSETIKYLD